VLIEDELTDLIEVRNKLAHGQWSYPLNSKGDDVANEQMKSLKETNALALSAKKRLVESFCAAMHDLVVSQRTFDRDFDDHFRQIQTARTDLQCRDYGRHEAVLRAKWARGRTRRDS
jgi:hypothetical protein